ncbi:hypothetical protein VDP28_21670, partial [Xanthomonas campestris pv. campestris]|nr:hypothetical protein [Xanthomonas campestris pv. campestris]MEB1241853.1 hypothetical protein [Xanthomonas campestris pv. campestris]MEB1486510.1 hypothetical protein [Xanthomonas campestris pv. campestris]MEB1506909.1 hypothetical protein [Xanthomonas campestris pv. campestris]MEB1511088.1 hypothetical protein [Xanthomonas campestris pv. campestris]
MGSRLKAKIKPEVLHWARETAGYSVASAASALKIKQSPLKNPQSPNARKALMSAAACQNYQ